MERKLTTNVNVGGTWYGPNDKVPDHVAELITNPKVWDGEDDTAMSDGVVDPKQAKEGVGAVKQPPRKGPGSGGPAWTEFAASRGVTESFDSKDALIAELEKRDLLDKE